MIEYASLEKDDAELILNAWGANPRNFEYLTSEVLHSPDLAKKYIDLTIGNKSNVAYHIKLSGVVVGLIKVKIENDRATIGYVVDELYCGNGYASQAVTHITKELSALPAIQRIEATCSPRNRGSIKVLEKCGFEKEALLKNWVIYPLQGIMAQDNYLFVWSDV